MSLAAPEMELAMALAGRPGLVAADGSVVPGSHVEAR
jgi:hypothetical protein